MKTLITVILLAFFIPSGAQPAFYILTPSDTVCNGTKVTFQADESPFTPHYYRWYVDTTLAASDSVYFIADSLQNGDRVYCLLLDTLDNEMAHSDTVHIVVQHPISAGAIVGPDSVCEQTTVTFTDSIQGGTWRAKSFYANLQGGAYTGQIYSYYGCPTPAPDTIYFTVHNSCGTNTTTKPITVLPQPQPYLNIEGCFQIGENFGYPSTMSEGPAYCSGTLSSNSADLVVESASNSGIYFRAYQLGDYIISNTDSNSCGVLTYNLPVRISLPPSPGEIKIPDGPLCMGDVITLYDTNSVGYAPFWSCTGNARVDNLTGVTTLLQSGTVNITVMVTSYCNYYMGTTATFTVNGVPQVWADADSFCTETGNQLHTNLPGGSWTATMPGITEIDTATAIAYGKAQGATRIIYTTKQGCKDTLSTAVSNCEESVQLFPNPTFSTINLQAPLNEEMRCYIQNEMGQTVIEKILSGNQQTIDLDALPPGLYIVSVVTKSGTQKFRVTKL